MDVSRTDDGLAILLADEDETARLGAALAAILPDSAVVGLIGPLGAGKTRLARAIAEGSGVDPSAIASPTYVLIHEYDGDRPISHFDTYRLSDPDAFDALGAVEYFDAGGICLIEWADRVADRLPPRTWWLRFEPIEGTRRRVLLTIPGDPVAMERLQEELASAGG